MACQDLAASMVDQLAAWGIKTIYGVTGNDILPFLDAMARKDKIRYISAAHETGAAFMASYHAKLTGELGVCISSAAGAVNLAEGLADAFLDGGAPVLALTGQTATSKIGTPAKQYLRQQGLMGNFTAYTELVIDAPAGIRLLIRAMSQALQTMAVSHLSIPENLWTRPVEAEPAAMPPLVKNIRGSNYCVGDLEQVAGLMQRARKPLVLVGSRGREASRKIQHLATAWGAAVVVAQEAKGVLPDIWPQVIGGIGETWLPPLVAECDCILLIGSAPYEERFLPGVTVIQVETYPWQINDVYLWNSLAGDIPYIIDSLTQRLQSYKPAPPWLDAISSTKKTLIELIENDKQNNNSPIHPARLMTAFNQVVADDAIIAVDVGAFNHWFDRDFQATEQKILLSACWRSMGAGVPAAIAARINYPEKQVIALVGDGSLLMSLGELATAVKNRLPITVVTVNNHLYGLEKDKTLAAGFAPLGLELQAVDFSKTAQAFGAQGFRVEDAAHLEETLRHALSLQEPAVVDVLCGDVRLPYLGH